MTELILTPILGLLLALPAAAAAPVAAAPVADDGRIVVVVNAAAGREAHGDRWAEVLEACETLARTSETGAGTGRETDTVPGADPPAGDGSATRSAARAAARVLDAGKAHEEAIGEPLAVVGYPSEDATRKARWLRRWLGAKARPGGTIVLVGDERALPTWDVQLGGIRLTSDSFYSDLDGDGVPETAVARVLGGADLTIRQLAGRRSLLAGGGPARARAAILCSEDTRIHLETRAFLHFLSGLGYEVDIRGARDDDALGGADVIVHFGHGTPHGLLNRFGEAFVDVGDASMRGIPELARSPLVFVDGCGTLPVGSPLLRAFLDKGAVGYAGSTAVVLGMTPARYTNELVEHFLDCLKDRPRATLPRALAEARARYVSGHPGLAASLRELADAGRRDARGEERDHLLTAAEWVYHGDPLAAIARAGPPVPAARRALRLDAPARLDPASPAWKGSFERREGEGQAVLAVRAEVPLAERTLFRLCVREGGREVAVLDGSRDTVYQRIGRDCRGGYAAGDRYRARFLVPLGPARGERTIEIVLADGSFALLTEGTEVDVWPPDFEDRIRLRRERDSTGPGRRVETPRPQDGGAP